MAKQLRPVKGSYKVKMGPNAKPIPHEEGWRHALDNALAKKSGWPKGDNMAVVEFSARINVVNPGSIVEYVVMLVPQD
jgi:hypothetical protein